MKNNAANSHVLYNDLGKKYTTIVRGDGVYVYDDEGKRYFDAIGGVGVVNIGHAVPEIISVMKEQAAKISFCYSGLVDNEPQRALAQKLDDWATSGMGDTRTLFSSGGAEANETALKIAYQYFWELGASSKRKVIGRWQSYHGDTVAALSMSGRTQWRKVFSPLLLDFLHIPPPYCYRCRFGLSYPACQTYCAYELERAILQEGSENIAAFIAEPVIGTSLSAVVPPQDYYQIIRDICDHYDILFIVDEVMSGVGRIGEKWGIDYWKVAPDIIVASKGISSGYSPLGATIVSEKIWRVINEKSKKITHGYTYGGNPLSCAVGLAVLGYMEKNNLIERAGIMGEKLIQTLRKSLLDLPFVGDVRGKGLFIGIEIVANKETKETFPVEWNVSSKMVDQLFDDGLIALTGIRGLLNGVAGDHFEMTPPYIIQDEHIELIERTLKESMLKTISRL